MVPISLTSRAERNFEGRGVASNEKKDDKTGTGPQIVWEAEKRT